MSAHNFSIQPGICAIADVHGRAVEAREAVELYGAAWCESIERMPLHDVPDCEVGYLTRMNRILRTLCSQYERCTLSSNDPRPLGDGPGPTPMSAIGSQLTQTLGTQWAQCLDVLSVSGSVRATPRPFYYLSICLPICLPICLFYLPAYHICSYCISICLPVPIGGTAVP